MQKKASEELSSSKDLIAMLENSTPFDGLGTQYLQHQYYKENFNFLVSCYGSCTLSRKCLMTGHYHKHRCTNIVNNEFSTAQNFCGFR